MDNFKNARTRLLKKHSGKCGYWQILGEDPNADMGGSHICPNLGYYKGLYDDVVEYALTLPRFFSWGDGGNVEEIIINELDATWVNERKRLENKRKELKMELDELDRTLKTM